MLIATAILTCGDPLTAQRSASLSSAMLRESAPRSVRRTARSQTGLIGEKELGRHPEEEEGGLPPKAGLETRFAQALSGLFSSLVPAPSDLQSLLSAAAGVNQQGLA